MNNNDLFSGFYFVTFINKHSTRDFVYRNIFSHVDLDKGELRCKLY